MNTVQEMVTGEIERLIAAAGLTTGRAPRFANAGALLAMRGLEPVLAVAYDFQARYATLGLSGAAVEQAPFELLAAQHALRRNRVCRDALPVTGYDVPLTPAAVADRDGLSIQFHRVDFAVPGEVQEFLAVLAALLALPASREDRVQEDELARLAAAVLARPDAAAALGFVLRQPSGGPCGGPGGNHWACAGEPGPDPAAEARLARLAVELGVTGQDLYETVHGYASTPASDANNLGLPGQIAYLVLHAGAAEAEREIRDAARRQAGPPEAG